MSDSSQSKKTVSSSSQKAARMIGKYPVISKIAEGGMGAVFKGKHPTLNRFIILKRLSSKSAASLSERFKREAKIMMDFKNEHIAQVYDHFKEGSSYYIIEEYIDGYSLGELIKKERYLSNEAALLIMQDCCKALKYAHEKNVVHRDIKPANILISRQGEVKLVDFGIASSMDESEQGLTKDGMVLGTPAYMSPEQIKDTKTVDKRADIYSLGVMLYEMVAGKPPFPGNFSPDAIALIVKGKYVPVHKVNPKVSPFVRKLIKKMMHYKPKKRYQDLGIVIDLITKKLAQKNKRNYNDELKNYLAGKPLENIVKKSKFKLVFFSLILAAVLGGGTFTLLFIYQYNFYYEILWPKEYGAFKVYVTVEKSRKEVKDLYLNSYVYKEEQVNEAQEGEDAPELKITKENLRFSLVPDRETENSYVLGSQKIYMPTGLYQLNINYENNYFFKSFYLEPREIQKSNTEIGDFRRIEVAMKSVSRLPLNFNYKVINAYTGKDITAGTDSSVYLNSKWRNLTGIDNNDLSSGKEYSFNFDHNGFFPQKYVTYIEPYNRSLDLYIELVPKPGKVLLTSDTNGIQILLNESKNYLTYEGENLIYKQLPSSKEEGGELLLVPGEYIITAKVSDEIREDIELNVTSDKTLNIILKYDSKNKILEFNMAR